MSQLRLNRSTPVYGKDIGAAPKDKEEWLVFVGCERFEWYDGWQDDFTNIKW